MQFPLNLKKVQVILADLQEYLKRRDEFLSCLNQSQKSRAMSWAFGTSGESDMVARILCIVSIIMYPRSHGPNE